jgi:hypothetical protein
MPFVWSPIEVAASRGMDSASHPQLENGKVSDILVGVGESKGEPTMNALKGTKGHHCRK